MGRPQFIVTPGSGEARRKDLHFSSAVRIGDRVETPGHGGWNDDLEIPSEIDEEIKATFGNIERPVLRPLGRAGPKGRRRNMLDHRPRAARR